MKKLILLLAVLLFAPCSALAAPPSPWLTDGDSGATIEGTVAIGTPLFTESVETTIQEYKIENSASEEMVSYSMTIEISDETDATEDVIVREYMLVGGTLGMVSSTKLYTAAPHGSEAPVYGCRVIADITWDPASIGSGGAYWVWWDGDSWEVINGQAN